VQLGWSGVRVAGSSKIRRASACKPVFYSSVTSKEIGNVKIFYTH